jgi:hypothetical protein
LIFSRFLLTLYLFFLCEKRILSFSENWKPLTCGALRSVALRPVPGPLIRWRCPPGAEQRQRPPRVRHAIKAPAAVGTRSEAASRPTRSPGPRLATPLLSEHHGWDAVRSRLSPRALARSEARHPTAVRAPRSRCGSKLSAPCPSAALTPPLPVCAVPGEPCRRAPSSSPR